MGCPFVLLFWEGLQGHHPCPIPGEIKPTRRKQSRDGEDSDPIAPCTFGEFKPISFPLLCLSQFELSFCHVQHKGSLNQYNECLAKRRAKIRSEAAGNEEKKEQERDMRDKLIQAPGNCVRLFLNHVNDFALELEIGGQRRSIYTTGSGKRYKLWLLVPPPPSHNPHPRRPVAKHLPGLHILRKARFMWAWLFRQV